MSTSLEPLATGGTTRHRPLPYPTLPVLHSANAAGLIHPDDRKYGTLLVGGQGSGKTAALLRTYLNDIRDPNAAVVLLDPKSELSRLCLKLTPPDTPKRVWYLDLGHPAFGMSPLRLTTDDPLALQATAIADNIVAALLDINENQIFQSSRRYLYHAVIGAIALAAKSSTRARFEDVYQLLMPSNADFRTAVFEACADTPDLDQTAEFFRTELPQDLQLATSATAQRLDAPRNKVSGLTGVPPLRRFFNHSADVALGDIIRARDILIVDANMATIGAENSRACMHFVLRMLHTQLQRQVQLPAHERPRVALLADEAHYVASAENVVDQIATHRAAGLDVTFGLQYFAQLGSASEHRDKIRKGIINLLQNRLLFRLGDHEDAEDATRIAMAVYATMIRDDPDARARMRVTPEQLLNLPVHTCLASWITGGSRAASFVGHTFPFPAEISDAWAAHHLAALDARLAVDDDEPPPLPRPPVDRHAAVPVLSADDVPRTANPSSPRTTSANSPDLGQPPSRAPDQPRRDPRPSGRAVQTERADVSPAARQSQPPSAPSPRVQRRPSPPASLADTDPVLELIRPCEPAPAVDETPAPASLSELAFIDRINEVKPPEHQAPGERLPRLSDIDYAILALLDRIGLALPAQIARAVQPDDDPRNIRHRLSKLFEAGLIARSGIGIASRTSADGRLPPLLSITRPGLRAAQERTPPAIHPGREWRATEARRAGMVPHDLHALSWAIEFHRVAGDAATDYWRTPRYATGRYPVPQVGNGHKRHPITPGEIKLPEGHAILDLGPFREIKPDLSLEVRTREPRMTLDVLIELDLTSRPAYNLDKLRNYDAFLTGWAAAHHRYRALATRPLVLFVHRDHRSALACAKEADAILTGRVGTMGTNAREWDFAARKRVMFAAEPEIHHSSLRVFALDSLPASHRGSSASAVVSVTLDRLRQRDA